jgi:glucose-6-phosphate dehydrogenase assembly protein OpcA
LIVLAEESDDPAGLGETMAALMPEHPARAILIRLRAARERILSERVYAQCWMPFGQRRQICCEQVEITVSDPALGDLAPVLLPLAVPDLPVIVWCRSPRLLSMLEFRRIAELAHKVILDGADFPDAKAALRVVERAVDAGLLMGDLAWTRLTRWREMLAQVFENRRHLALLLAISRIRIRHSPRHAVSARYIGAWVANALSDAGVRAELHISPSDEPFRMELLGEGLSVELTRQDQRLTIRVNDLAQCTNLPEPTDYLLLREELALVRRDPVFERTLASAVRLSYATDK